MGCAQSGVPGIRLNPQTVRMADMTAAMDITDAHLAGNRLLVSTSGLAADLTIPLGLVAKEPLTVINDGAGLITFVAAVGVTLKAPGSFLTFAQTPGMAVIIPDHNAADTYWVAGDLA